MRALTDICAQVLHLPHKRTLIRQRRKLAALDTCEPEIFEKFREVVSHVCLRACAYYLCGQQQILAVVTTQLLFKKLSFISIQVEYHYVYWIIIIMK